MKGRIYDAFAPTLVAMEPPVWTAVWLSLGLTAAQSGNVTVPMLPADAAPRIVQLLFPHGLSIAHPGEFTGIISTSSNVASVEVRTNLFSINALKEDVGRFTFDVDVYDVPAIFIRPYTLRIIARNTRGDETEEDVPFRIR